MTGILIVSDHPAVRRMLKLQLELDPELRVTGEAADARSTLEQGLALEPDVIVIDLSIADMDVFDTTRKLRAELAGTHVILISSEDDHWQRVQARQAGAAALFRKEASMALLVKAIHQLRTGGLSQEETVLSNGI